MSTRPGDTYPSLLPPQATELERDLEQVTARVGEVPTPLASWDADTCPANLLGWLAWALSVDEWDPAWPEDIKREAIRIAPLLHQRKGTVWAVKNALKPLGTETLIEEWWAMQPPGQPGTFRATTMVSRSDIATTQGPLLTPALANKLRDVIDQTKPVSRSFALRVGVTFKSRSREATALRPAQHLRVDGREKVTHTARATHRTAAALRPAQRLSIILTPTP